MTSDLAKIAASLGDRLIDRRDAALLTIGFAGAMRRSELVALDIDDVEDTDDGLVIHIRRSKTDQAGEGRIIGVPFASRPSLCPVRNLRQWLEISGTESGPVFRPVRVPRSHRCVLRGSSHEFGGGEWRVSDAPKLGTLR